MKPSVLAGFGFRVDSEEVTVWLQGFDMHDDEIDWTIAMGDRASQVKLSVNIWGLNEGGVVGEVTSYLLGGVGVCGGG